PLRIRNLFQRSDHAYPTAGNVGLSYQFNDSIPHPIPFLSNEKNSFSRSRRSVLLLHPRCLGETPPLRAISRARKRQTRGDDLDDRKRHPDNFISPFRL